MTDPSKGTDFPAPLRNKTRGCGQVNRLHQRHDPRRNEETAIRPGPAQMRSLCRAGAPKATGDEVPRYSAAVTAIGLLGCVVQLA